MRSRWHANWRIGWAFLEGPRRARHASFVQGHVKAAVMMGDLESRVAGDGASSSAQGMRDIQQGESKRSAQTVERNFTTPLELYAKRPLPPWREQPSNKWQRRATKVRPRAIGSSRRGRTCRIVRHILQKVKRFVSASTRLERSASARPRNANIAMCAEYATVGGMPCSSATRRTRKTHHHQIRWGQNEGL